jgi:hypothetical protein
MRPMRVRLYRLAGQQELSERKPDPRAPAVSPLTLVIRNFTAATWEWRT